VRFRADLPLADLKAQLIVSRLAGLGEIQSTRPDVDQLADASDLDSDNDGIPDVSDAFPLDTDNDGIDNSVDNDDDNDGFLDTDEIASGTDPLDPSSYPGSGISGDITGDGVVNIADILICTRIVLGLANSPNQNICDISPLDSQGTPQSDGQVDAGDISVLFRKAFGM
jgi:hypothetical protein